MRWEGEQRSTPLHAPAQCRRERQALEADSTIARRNLAAYLLWLTYNGSSKLQLLRRNWKLTISLFSFPLHRPRFNVILLLQGYFQPAWESSTTFVDLELNRWHCAGCLCQKLQERLIILSYLQSWFCQGFHLVGAASMHTDFLSKQSKTAVA